MDNVIKFFRDTLDGPFYIAWVVVLVIFIFACIGYLAEKGIKNKKERAKYATVDHTFDSDNETVVDDITIDNSVDTPSKVAITDTTTYKTPSAAVSEVATNNDTQIEQPTNTTVEEVTNANANVNANNITPKEVVQPVNNTTTNPVVEEVQTPSVTTTVVSPPPTNNVPTVNSNVVIPTINQDENNKEINS